VVVVGYYKHLVAVVVGYYKHLVVVVVGKLANSLEHLVVDTHWEVPGIEKRKDLDNLLEVEDNLFVLALWHKEGVAVAVLDCMSLLEDIGRKVVLC